MGLDSVELVLSAEKQYGISIADEEAGNIRTVGDFTLAIQRNLRQTGVERDETELFAEVRILVKEQLGVEWDAIRWEALFVDDLGMD